MINIIEFLKSDQQIENTHSLSFKIKLSGWKISDVKFLKQYGFKEITTRIIETTNYLFAWFDKSSFKSINKNIKKIVKILNNFFNSRCCYMNLENIICN